MSEGAHSSTCWAIHCKKSAQNIATGTAAKMTILLKIKRIKPNTKKGQRNKNLLRKPRVLTNELYGNENCFTDPSLLKPLSLRARFHARVDPISSATWSGVFPVEVFAKRSALYSRIFCMQTGEPFTNAQWSAVKPSSSETLTLAPHRRKRSTQAGYPLYAAHIKEVCPWRSGPSIGIF